MVFDISNVLLQRYRRPVTLTDYIYIYIEDVKQGCVHDPPNRLMLETNLCFECFTLALER